MTEYEVENRLNEIGGRFFMGGEDGWAALLEATAVVNEHIIGTSPAATVTAGTPERLGRWVERLKGIGESVARTVGASEVQVSVSIPVGVSVGLTWPTSSGENRVRIHS